ncbi:MAG: hypothetical protein ACFFA5_09085 [Promethearchaeota archaeon]
MTFTNGYLFLSKLWIDKIVSAIEDARAIDPELMAKTSEFSLSVAYIVENLPQKIRELYESDKVVIYVEMDKGNLKQFNVSKEVPSEKVLDFIVTARYEIAKKNFQGELNLLSTFIKRLIKVSPWRKISTNPTFTIKSLSTMIELMKVMREVPTIFL